ncbi:lysine-specific permease [Salmonella enterica subsp. enterica]|uniref:Lysine-specific permease n=1 Tax=Salmonella enterica I TaxID=59201 RepID=A0A447TZU5_SALET|nr:lysine-specific permease [Salmonella enterica subsp. enterica]
MIAIGGSIGTGLFVASGATISQAGPGGALFSYILIGFDGLLPDDQSWRAGGLYAGIWLVCDIWSETMWKKALVSRWAGTTGTNWAVTIAVDLVAAQLVMGWWFPDTPGWIWSALFLCVIFFAETTFLYAVLARRSTGSR